MEHIDDENKHASVDASNLVGLDIKTIDGNYHPAIDNRDILFWERVELKNANVGIARNNAHIDANGYIRWNDGNELCHRDIAFRNGKARNDIKFSECDVHHIDGDRFNNNPENLQCLTREEHQEMHGTIIIEGDKKYIKACHLDKIKRETSKAYLFARKWFPKSESIKKNGYLYVSEWIYHQKFGTSS